MASKTSYQGIIQFWLFHHLNSPHSNSPHLSSPPLKQQDSIRWKVCLFERGKNFERGRSPLSLTLPSPAINIYEFMPMFPAGEGTGVRLSHNNQMQTEPLSVVSREGKGKAVFLRVGLTGYKYTCSIAIITKS